MPGNIPREKRQHADESSSNGGGLTRRSNICSRPEVAPLTSTPGITDNARVSSTAPAVARVIYDEIFISIDISSLARKTRRRARHGGRDTPSDNISSRDYLVTTFTSTSKHGPMDLVTFIERREKTKGLPSRKMWIAGGNDPDLEAWYFATNIIFARERYFQRYFILLRATDITARVNGSRKLSRPRLRKREAVQIFFFIRFKCRRSGSLQRDLAGDRGGRVRGWVFESWGKFLIGLFALPAESRSIKPGHNFRPAAFLARSQDTSRVPTKLLSYPHVPQACLRERAGSINLIR